MRRTTLVLKDYVTALPVGSTLDVTVRSVGGPGSTVIRGVFAPIVYSLPIITSLL
jgi:hypothetical protein